MWMVVYVLGGAFRQDVQVKTDRSTENADAIRQEVFDVLKGLICWEIRRATANL